MFRRNIQKSLPPRSSSLFYEYFFDSALFYAGRNVARIERKSKIVLKKIQKSCEPFDDTRNNLARNGTNWESSLHSISICSESPAREMIELRESVTKSTQAILSNEIPSFRWKYQICECECPEKRGAVDSYAICCWIKLDPRGNKIRKAGSRFAFLSNRYVPFFSFSMTAPSFCWIAATLRCI